MYSGLNSLIINFIIMKPEIKKDYELRKVGNKIVLRQMSIPDYEMKTTLVADEILDVSDNVFALKYNEKFFCLCREDKKGHLLHTVSIVEKYEILGEQIVYSQNGTWHLWQEDFHVKILGKAEDLNNFLFVLKVFEGKLWSGKYIFSYFQNGKLCQKECSDYEKLASQSAQGLEADIMKIRLKDGWRFVSCMRRCKMSEHLGMKIPESTFETKIIFTESPCLKLVEYANFVEDFLKKKEKFGNALSEDSVLVNALWDGKTPDAKRVLVPYFEGCLVQNLDLNIHADVWRMFQGYKHEVYQVSCPTLGYEQKADDVFMDKYNGQSCLFVCRGKKSDKFVCVKEGMRYRLELLKD